MKYLVAILCAAFCASASAGEVGIEPWLQHPLDSRPEEPRCGGRWEWRSRVLRTYWKRLPCGRWELWEDVEHYRVWVGSPKRIYPSRVTIIYE